MPGTASSDEERSICVKNWSTVGGLKHSKGKIYFAPWQEKCVTSTFQASRLIGRHLADKKGGNV